jgi:hypothetical protein
LTLLFTLILILCTGVCVDRYHGSIHLIMINRSDDPHIQNARARARANAAMLSSSSFACSEICQNLVLNSTRTGHTHGAGDAAENRYPNTGTGAHTCRSYEPNRASIQVEIYMNERTRLLSTTINHHRQAHSAAKTANNRTLLEESQAGPAYKAIKIMWRDGRVCVGEEESRGITCSSVSVGRIVG